MLRPIVQAIARFVLPFLRADSGLLFSHNPLGPVDTTDNSNNSLMRQTDMSQRQQASARKPPVVDAPLGASQRQCPGVLPS